MRMGRCGNAEDIKRTRKEREEKAPKSLPRIRPRALTSPHPSSQRPSWNPFKKSVPQLTLDQSQSALFGQLPSEVRQIVWIQFISGHLLHIARAHKRLLAIDCTEKETEKEKLDAGSGCRFRTRFHGCWGHKSGHNTTPGFYLSSRTKHPAKPVNLLPILQTCRRIYTETISMLYENNLFDINHLDTIFYLRQTILPERLKQIRVLNLTWNFKHGANPTYSSVPYNLATWLEACDAIARSFTGLRELTLHLTGNELLPLSSGGGKKWSEPWLEPLKHIKPAKRFDVFVNWSEEACEKARKEGYAFRFLSEIEAELRNDDTMEL